MKQEDMLMPMKQTELWSHLQLERKGACVVGTVMTRGAPLLRSELYWEYVTDY